MSAPTINARAAATEIARRLQQAGHVAYFAGGCVRDHLLGHDPEDFDVATDATPEEVRRIFPKAQGVGAAFGVMLVRLEGHIIEVATFRSDGPYSDGRRPDEVIYADAEHDALRRDFTINGLFEDPVTGEVIDHVQGQQDMRERVLRAIGNPDDRLREDRLRMLRAVRFAARYGLSIDPDTARAIREGAGQLDGVSRERIGNEIRRMLSHPSRVRAVELLVELGLDDVIFREKAAQPSMRRLAGLPSAAWWITALAAWWLDRHEAATPSPGTSGSPGAAEPTSAYPDIRQSARCLVLSNEERAELAATLAARMTILRDWRDMAVAAKKRLAVREVFTAALDLVAVDDAPLAEQVKRDVADLGRTPSGLSPAPLLTGDDLIEAGHRPGPAFARVLEAVYDVQLEDRIATRAAALSLAAELMADGGAAADSGRTGS